jgi:hypothetical protein
MKSQKPEEEIPWALLENLKGIAGSMLAAGEAPNSDRIMKAMQQSLQSFHDSEWQARSLRLDQQLAFLREAEDEVARELQEIRENAGLFNRKGGIPDLDKAQRILNSYGRKRSRKWCVILIKIFGTLLCSLLMVFITMDAMQDDRGDPSMIGWLQNNYQFKIEIIRPWLFVVVMFLLGKLFFRFFFQIVPSLEPSKRIRPAYAFLCACCMLITLAGWYLISIEMPKDQRKPSNSAGISPENKIDRTKNM